MTQILRGCPCFDEPTQPGVGLKQSSPDPRMPLRLLVYSALYWEREWKAWEQEHPPVRRWEC